MTKQTREQRTPTPDRAAWLHAWHAQLASELVVRYPSTDVRAWIAWLEHRSDERPVAYGYEEEVTHGE